MKIALSLAVAAAAVSGYLVSQDREGPVSPPERTRFLFAAVVEGLAEDGFDPKLAGEIGDNAHLWFVKSCPVCESVLLAFRAYKASCDNWRMKSDPWSGSRVPGATVDALRGAETEKRHKAFEGLIAKYVKNRFDRFKMTGDQRDRMQESLKIGMKEGLGFLKESGSEDKFPVSCPSCQGAN